MAITKIHARSVYDSRGMFFGFYFCWQTQSIDTDVGGDDADAIRHG